VEQNKKSKQKMFSNVNFLGNGSNLTFSRIQILEWNKILGKLYKKNISLLQEIKNGCKNFYQYLNQFWNENLDPTLETLKKNWLVI